MLSIIGAITFAIFVLNLPTQYNPYRPDLIQEENFSEEDKKKTGSGYGYFSKHRGTDKTLKAETSVTVLVLGDIGRSPRMQYHVASIAKHGGKVTLIGYVESEILPEVTESRFVKIVALSPVPEKLRNASPYMFPLIAPLKVLFQLWDVWRACGYRTKPTKWMLVQNPPSIPTLLIAQAICFVRNTKLIIDWHNFGHTILALKLGDSHLLVKIYELYEQYVARLATAHFCVTNAMARVLKQRYGVDALPLHDRPAKQFQPISSVQRSEVLHRLKGTASRAKQIEEKQWRLLVSSTSWTADEDFSILLDALVAYSATVSMDRRYPKILAVITGKGPQKDYYLRQIEKLKERKRLSNVSIKTAWLSMEDYASLLGAADVGVSLHKSTSGVDLPMKVVDMFGTGLPVFGYSKFESWPELVTDGVNGMGFEKADELETLLERAFSGNGDRLNKLREGATKETKRRWDDEWFPVAGSLFKMSGTTMESDVRPQLQQEKSTYSFMKPTPVEYKPLSSLGNNVESPRENVTTISSSQKEEPFVGPAVPIATEPQAATITAPAPAQTIYNQEIGPQPPVEQTHEEHSQELRPQPPIENLREEFQEDAKHPHETGPLESVREEPSHTIASEVPEETVRERLAYTIIEPGSEETTGPIFPVSHNTEGGSGGTFLSYR